MEADRYEDFIYEAEEEQPQLRRHKLRWKSSGGRGSNPTVAALRDEQLSIELNQDIERHRRAEEYAS